MAPGPLLCPAPAWLGEKPQMSCCKAVALAGCQRYLPARRSVVWRLTAVQELLEVFEGDDDAGEAVLETMMEHGLWRECLHLHAQQLRQEGDQPQGRRAELYGSAISALATMRQWQRALALLGEIRSSAVEPSCFEEVGARSLCRGAVAACSAGGCWQELLVLMQELRGKGAAQLSVEACRDAISSLNKASRWQESLAFFEDLRGQGSSDDPAGESPEVLRVQWSQVYSVAMRSWGLGRCWQGALELLEDMSGQRLQLGNDAFMGAIDACSHASTGSGNSKPAPRHANVNEDQTRAVAATTRRLLREMHQRQLQPNVFTYCRTITACARAREPDEALQLLEEMTTEDADLWPDGPLRPNKAIFHSCISACEKAGRWEQALVLLEDMPSRESFSFSGCIFACAHGGAWCWALELFDRMNHQALAAELSVYSGLISACSKARGNGWQMTLLILATMKQALSCPPTAVSYNEAISACDQGRQWIWALDLLRVMAEDEVPPDIISFGAAISACEHACEWLRALELHEELLRRKLQPNLITFSLAVTACRNKLAELLEAASQPEDGGRKKLL
eukprot:TRINITY_DN87222_c0_g1_i1.p1 TRINITY_DN87222_c0_g1~~TRINITY_DN87222_c0_g1_i1.p1  ORF type:complete len:577 (-),score=112.34 TRINITY_DN87222_c0_g1_i1:569-2269(-)